MSALQIIGLVLLVLVAFVAGAATMLLKVLRDAVDSGEISLQEDRDRL
jgi:hypothetical protein